MNPIIEIILFIWSILCLILFFKIWGATNRLNEIRDLLANKLTDIERPMQESASIKGNIPQIPAEDSRPQSQNYEKGDKWLILILSIIIILIVIMILAVI